MAEIKVEKVTLDKLDMLQKLSIDTFRETFGFDNTEEELQEFIAKHLFERIPYYEKAKFHIDSNGKISHEIVKEILVKS